MDILNILLIIVVLFLFPLGQVFRIDIGNGIAINPLDIGMVFVAVVTIIVAIRKKKLPYFIKPLGIFWGVGFLSLFINVKTVTPPELIVSLMYILRFIVYAVIGVGVFALSKKKKEFLWKELLIGGGIIVAAGYIQYFFYPSLWGMVYEGWDPHLYRMFSTFLDPNFSGVFFVLYFLLVLHTWFLQKNLRGKIIFGVVGLLTFLAVIVSFSRGAYVDLGISVLVYLFLKGYKKIAIAIPVVVIVLGFLFAFFVPFGEGKNLLRTVSTQARLVSVENALTIFEKNPILGVGFDTYRYAQHRYHLSGGSSWENSHSGAGVDNSYVFVLATTGVIGIIVYGYFWLIVLRSMVELLKKKKPHALFFLASLVALLVSGLFENTLFYPSLMVWLFVLLGLTG